MLTLVVTGPALAFRPFDGTDAAVADNGSQNPLELKARHLLGVSKIGKRSLHFLQVRVLTSSHALVFGSLKRTLVSLPRFQDGQLLGDVDVVGFDNIHRTLKFLCGVERHPRRILIIVHDFLVLVNSSADVLSTHAIASWP